MTPLLQMFQWLPIALKINDLFLHGRQDLHDLVSVYLSDIISYFSLHSHSRYMGFLTVLYTGQVGSYLRASAHAITPGLLMANSLSSFSSVQFSSVAQSCPTLCDPMNRSTPGLPVHHHLPGFTQTHVRWVCDAIQPSHPLLSPSPPAPNPSHHQSLFQWVNSSHEVAKVLELQL